MPLPDFLTSVPYLATLNTEEIKRIEKETRELTLSKGETLFLEGEPCYGLYVVKSGQVRLFKSSPEGRQQVLFIAKPGDTLNDVPVFDGGPNPASASALEPATVYFIPKETLLSLVANSPTALGIIRVLATRVRHLTTLIEDLSFRSVVSRLGKTLLDLAVVEGGPSPVRHLTQDELAAMVGSVRDVVSRALRALEKAGTIRIEGRRIIIVDPQKLREMS